jgi:cupin superfamily acireductone dioxygenase involved in methionine salvage
MKQRIENPNCDAFEHFGGRGLTHEFPLFIDFYDYLFDSYKEHCDIYGENNTSIERINNDIGYVRGNITWVPLDKQCNNKRNTVYFYYESSKSEQDVGRNLEEFARCHGLSSKEIRYCMKNIKLTKQGWYFIEISKEAHQYALSVKESFRDKDEFELLEIIERNDILMPENGTKKNLINNMAVAALLKKYYSRFKNI